MVDKLTRAEAYRKLGSISTHQLQVPYEYKYLSKPLLSIKFLDSSTNVNRSTLRMSATAKAGNRKREWEFTQKLHGQKGDDCS